MTSPNQLFTDQTLQILQKCKTLNSLKQVHAQMITNGQTLHTYPLSKLLILSSTLSVSYALSIFTQIQNPTIFLYNTIISSLTTSNKTNNIAIALTLYNQVLNHKHNTIKPNNFTYPSLFKACGSHPWIQHGRILHTHVLKFLGPTCDDYVKASVMNFYANCGELDLGRYLFSQIQNPDLASWNSILTAYSRSSGLSCGDNDYNFFMETLCLFDEMRNSVVNPNEVTLVALITSCANLGAFSQGVWAHAYLIKHNLKLNRFVGTSLIEMYSKCGFPDLAHQVFERMPVRDTLCYNAMVSGLGSHGYGRKAIHMYNELKTEGLVPDDVTFVVAMSACSHVGMVEEGCEIFESIKAVYGIEPKVEHYGCLVDLLCRAGRLDEAKEKVQEMSMKPNVILWRCLLGAASINQNVEIGELALSRLVELEAERSGKYVLLSNMYASLGRWDDVKRLREVMKDRGVDIRPGSSLVEIGGARPEFLK